MDETKIFGEIYGLKEEVKEIKERLGNVETSLSNLTNVADKILHTVERIDQEKTVTNFRLDEHNTRITKLETQKV